MGRGAGRTVGRTVGRAAGRTVGRAVRGAVGRTVVRSGLSLGLALWTLGCAQETLPPPSIVLITIDTLRADHLGCYGYERARTPHLDALAEGGVLFENAHTVSNNTLPSHASILTGRYPHSIGIPRNSFPLAPEEATLATILQAAGYETAAFVSASALASPLGLARGFDLYDETFGVREMDQEQRRAEATTDAVLEWLDRQTTGSRAETPFFLWIHYFDPHYPYTPPEPYDRIYGEDYSGPADGSMEYLCTIWGLGTAPVPPGPADIQRMIDLYDGEIAYLDAQLGRLFRFLDESGLRSSTMTVVTSDHGESLDEHEYYFNHGLYLYEPSLHVPLIVQQPGGPPQGGQADGAGGATDGTHGPRRVATQVQTFDIFPTVLKAVGLNVAETVHGLDLTPLLTGAMDGRQRPPRPGPDPEADPGRRRYSYAESCRPWEVEQANPDAYRNLMKAHALIEGPWKLVATPYRGTTELYHLGRDPEETVNLAGQQSQRVSEMWQELRSWREGSLPGGPPDPENIERLRSLGYTR